MAGIILAKILGTSTKIAGVGVFEINFDINKQRLRILITNPHKTGDFFFRLAIYINYSELKTFALIFSVLQKTDMKNLIHRKNEFY